LAELIALGSVWVVLGALSTAKTFRRNRSGGQSRALDGGGATPHHAMAQVRRLGLFAGISVLAVVHQVRRR